MAAHTTKGLRRILDKNDGFLTGHQIHRIRRPRRVIPEWATDDKKVQHLLLHAFPKLADDDTQRRRAGRWARVIHLYFRSQKSYSEVAADMNEKPRTIEMLIRAIYRAINGKPVNGVIRVRNRAVIETPFGGQIKTVSEPASGRS